MLAASAGCQCQLLQLMLRAHLPLPAFVWLWIQHVWGLYAVLPGPMAQGISGTSWWVHRQLSCNGGLPCRAAAVPLSCLAPKAMAMACSLQASTFTLQRLIRVQRSKKARKDLIWPHLDVEAVGAALGSCRRAHKTPCSAWCRGRLLLAAATQCLCTRLVAQI